MAGGGTVTFACDGAITLASSIEIGTDTEFDGSEHQVTISGSNAVRVFYINTNVTLPVANLTIANGRSDRREPILKDKADRQRFRETFAGVCAKTG